jgi:TRAP-type C4-dicarboxylate transport system permease small subunit
MADSSAFDTKLNRALEGVLTVLLFLIFTMIVMLVVLRYVFNTTIIGGNEAALIAFVYTTAIGGALAVSKHEHIAIHYFVDLMPRRIQRRLRIFQLLLVATINLVIVCYSVVWISRTGGFLMPALQLPQLVAQLSIPIGCSLASVYCLIGVRRQPPAPH